MPSDDETAPASPTGVTELGTHGGPPVEVRLATADRYQLVEVLGRGGMGVVWTARDSVLDRVVALKVLHDRFGASGHQQRLADEARAMARLNHPNVVVVYDVGVRDGRTFLTMELVRGQTMSRWLEAPRSWQDVVAAFRAAGAGVAAAHAAGIVHRDLKPSNILIGDDGRVRVADFGVADARDPAELAGDVVLADTASTSGTPAYMAPERFRGAAADARSDQFSFAASLYEALHGRRPFEAPTVAALIEALHGPAPAPVRDVPAWLTRVVNRALARDPADRFPSMAALVAALSRRRRGWWIAAGAAVAVGAAVAIAAAAAIDAPCGDARQALAGVWDDAARSRLASATSPALAAGVAREADAWVAARDELCRAAHVYGELDATSLARGTACPGARRRALAAAGARLAIGDPRIAAAAPLPAASDCVDRERLARMIGTGGDVLAQARAALIVGDATRAAELAEQAARSAHAAGDALIEVEALLVRGDALLSSRIGAAAEAMTSAVATAGSLGVASLRLDAWIGLARAQVRLGQLETAASLVALAEAALADRADHRREAELAMVGAQLASQQARHADAAAAARRARAAWTAELGPGAAALPAGRLLVASLRALGRADEAVVEAEAQLASARPFGERHLEVGRAHFLLGGALAGRGDLARARPELERAVDVVRAAAGPSADLVAALAELGDVLARAGDRGGALARATEALAMAGDIGLTIRDTARLVRGLALLIVDSDPSRAETLIRQALADQLTALGPLHPEIAETHRALAQVLTALGRPADAAAALERATGPRASLPEP